MVTKRNLSGVNELRQGVSSIAVWLCISIALVCCGEGCAGKHNSVNPPIIPDKPSSPNWEDNMKKFEEMDREKPPKKGGIVFMGSSSIVMWKSLKDDFAPMNVINRGFGGSQIIDSVIYAHRIAIPYRPRIIVMYAGDNDITAGKTPDQVFEDFKKFAKVIHDALPKTRVQYISIKPSIKRWNLWDKMKEANGLIEAFAKKQKLVDYIDIATPMLGQAGKPGPELFIEDGLHLSDAGYRIWVVTVKPYLEK